MKELSIEEKTKAYDGNYKAYTELINRLEDVKEAIKKQNYGIAMDILFKPYPEFQVTTHSKLTESEDEEVRKALYEYFKNRKDDGDIDETWYGISYDEILAWLEKQGGQPKKHDVCDNCDQQGSCVSPCPMKLVEKQGEQKLAAKVEPKFKIGDKVHLINGSSPNYEDDCIVISDISNNTYYGNWEGGYFAIKDQDKYELVEQKPAWSEEDERNLDWLMTVCERIHYKSDPQVAPDSALMLKDWLKSLKDRVQSQPKQEWSEEDEIARNDIIAKLAILKSRAVDGGAEKEICEMEINWLKSLRPQNTWKPSDEQIDALRQVISGCSYDIEPLVEIEKQLKKLMEE